jgi:hypothetical protein
MFAIFLAFSLKTPEEPNWPVTAYLSGMVLLAIHLFPKQLGAASGGRRTGRWVFVGAACLLGLVVTALMHHSEWARSILRRLSGPAMAQRPFPLRRWDPTCRLRGWQTLAGEVDCARRELQSEGVDALVACSGWTLPGELGFYCQGQPDVYSFGPALGDRHSQYDLWRPSPILDPAAFRRRTFVYVGPVSPQLKSAFGEVGPSRTVLYEEGGEPLAGWTVTICRGFRGFDAADAALARRGF